MTEIELRRKEFERLLIKKDFKLSDSEVIAKAIELEKVLKKNTADT